jgi:hypothetical protein
MTKWWWESSFITVYYLSFKIWLSFFAGLAVLIAVKGNCARRALKKNSNF